MNPTVANVVPSRFSLLATSLFSGGLLLAQRPTLMVPVEGSVISTNTPTLAWSQVPADEYEIWINGFRTGVVPGRLNQFVPFPLSFGENRWQVVAVLGQERAASSEGSFIVDDAPLAPLPERSLLLRHGWSVQSSAIVGRDGAALSSPGQDTAGWSHTSLPATVLTALVRNGIYPNPYVGLNNTLIPDANDAFNEQHQLLRYSHLPGRNPWSDPYWYRTTFQVPETLQGSRLWLTFNEINYRAEVWLNGYRVATSIEMVGMDRQFRFDVTELIRRDQTNTLAVAIHPLDDPGEPAPPSTRPLADPGRNMGADANISRNYTKWDTVGWDWQPEIKDRDMGITEEVYLSATDDVELQDVYVTSHLPLPDTTVAELAVSVDLVNHATAPVTVRLRAGITSDQHEVAQWEEELTLPAGSRQRRSWTSREIAALRVDQPRLWWPAELGEPHLHSLQLELSTVEGARASLVSPFGIRTFSTRISPATQSRIFSVNGRDLYGRGGNWVADMMLNGTASSYEEQVELARRSHLNHLRVWGPTGAPPSAFFAAADRQGLLIWQDFLHDFWGTDNNQPGFAPDPELCRAATTAVIKRYRNHASLFLWCGGNEGPNPQEAMITGELLPQLDPGGSRHYLDSSLSDGLHGGGPYHTLVPQSYFGHPKLTGFNSEIGPSGVPVWESVRQFLPVPAVDWAPGRFPLDGAWAYHDANDRQDDERKYTAFDDLVRQRYGLSAETDEAAMQAYVDTSQLVNYEVYRAAMESLNQHRWRRSTGFALWKFNSSWPSLIWQVIDWYHRPHAGYYALRKAAGPLHVQFNAGDRTLSIVNRTSSTETGLVFDGALYDAAMNRVWWTSTPAALQANAAWTVSPPVPPLPGLHFLRLSLRDAFDRVRAENFYWLHDRDQFHGLADLATAKLDAQVDVPAHPDGRRYRVTLRNAGTAPALNVHLRLVAAHSGVEVRPTYWSDNFVSLLPGETTTCVAELPAGARGLEVPLVVVGAGFNLPEFTVAITAP
jgi:beta-galactosidase/beta-glucuronidase